MSILKQPLGSDDENEEIDFELRYLASLSRRERFLLMIRKSEEIKKMMRRRGYQKPFEIIKRA